MHRQHPPATRSSLLLRLLLLSMVFPVLHCAGGSGRSTGSAPQKKKKTAFEQAVEDCNVSRVEKACLDALEMPEGADPSARIGLLDTLCGRTSRQDVCCQHYAELPYREVQRPSDLSENRQGLALSFCGVYCFSRKPSRFCEAFEGANGETNRIRACEARSSEDDICGGIPEAKRNEIRSRIARVEREQKREQEQFAEDLRRRKEQDHEAYQRMSVTRATPANGGRTAPPTPPASPKPAARARTSCQYMFVTGGTGPSGWTKPERHFYDAPDCGGVCCTGQSVCCVDGTGTKEFCSETNRKTPADPEVHFCRDGGRMRDRRRDDYPVVPILPGER